METKGTIDGFPATIFYSMDGFQFLDISVQLGLVIFQWDQLSFLQQEQILRQLKTEWPMPEESFECLNFK